MGLASAVVIIVVTLGAAASGRLGHYIHPRYFGFTVTLALVAAVGVTAAAVVSAVRPSHEHEPGDGVHRGRSRAIAVGSSILTGALLLVIAVAPTTTLSQTTAAQRRIDNAAASITTDPGSVPAARRTVKDWVGMIRTGDDPAGLDGAPARMLGFVSPGGGGNDDFYVTRFLITCCAVDAQPIGVLVHSPGWQSRFATGSWVTVEGAFAINPDASSPEALILEPTSVSPTAEPRDAYVY